MKKNVRVIIIAVVCILVICGGFYLFSKGLNSGSEEELTEVEKLIVKDLEKDYPKTPREVVKFYNRILTCYYSGEATDEQIEKLAEQMMRLFDEDLLTANPRSEYLASVKQEIANYKQLKKHIVKTDVCGTNEVVYITDKEADETEGDEIAYVETSYFVKTGDQFSKTYQNIVLRQDEDGCWKLIAFYQIEGSEDDE